MNDFKEFTGKDVDEAIERACQFFDAKRDKLEIEIVSGGSTGIFGLVGKKKAVVKARMRGRAAMEAGLDEVRGKAAAEPRSEPKPETRPAVKAETRPAPRRAEPSLPPAPVAPAKPPAPPAPASAGGDEDFDDEVAPPGNRIEQPKVREGNRIEPPKVREGNRIEPPKVREGNRIEPPKVREGNRGEGEAPADRPDSRRRTHRGGRGRRGGGAREGRPDQSERQTQPQSERQTQPQPERQTQPGRQRRPEPARPAPAEPAKPLTADYDVEATVALAQGVVAKLVAPLCPEAPLTVEHEPGRIKIFIDAGADAELVIGSDGATIAALQYLANRMVARLSNAAVRVHLDAGEFREQQDEQLRQMALDLAAKAKEQGRTQSTRPLSSYHRRIIHLALQEDQTISTRSKGEGPLKRVLISPKKDQ